MTSYWGSPLVQFSKFNNFFWVCWFLCKNLSNFVYPVWKLHNPYCHKLRKLLKYFETVSIPKRDVVVRLTLDFSNLYLKLYLTSKQLEKKTFKKIVTSFFFQQWKLVNIIFNGFFKVWFSNIFVVNGFKTNNTWQK